MSSPQEREELDARARAGETVVPGGTGGKSLEAQEHLAQGFNIFIYRKKQGRADKEGSAGNRGVPGVRKQRWSSKERPDWNPRLPGDGPKRRPQYLDSVWWRTRRRRRHRHRRVQVQNQKHLMDGCQ